jgi:cytochrome c
MTSCLQRLAIALLFGGSTLAPAAFAGGDAGRGASLYSARCTGCHALNTDGVGPRHAGVVGRAAASVPGFAYSRALKQAKLTWNAATLDRWLADPEALVPGQQMDFSVNDARDRDDLVAYLATLQR